MHFLFVNKLKLEEPIIKKLSILVFIWSALLFFLNLQYNFLDEYDIIIFWLSTLLMIGTVIHQIIFIKNNTFVLFEILIIYFSLHLMFQIGYYGLRGSDSYVDYNLLKIILNDHNFVLGQGVEGWPMIHIFSSSFSLVTEIDPLPVAKFLPSFISSIIVLPLYLLIYNIYKNRKMALFSCLIFGTIPQFMSFEAAFVRETFALFIIILFFYILYISKKRNDYRLTLFSIFLIPVIVLAHHFTSLMIIILLGTYLVVLKLILHIHRKDVNIKKRVSGIINIKMIFLVTLVAVITYWIYHAVFVVEYSLDILYESIGLKVVTTTYVERLLNTPILTLRGNIIYYGFFFFHILFSLILLIKLITRKNNQKIEDTSFAMFFFFCMFCAFLAFSVLGSLLFPDRFLTFAWMFGIIPLVGYLLVLKRDMYKKILYVLLISFIVFNLYNIDMEYYTGNYSKIDVIATEKDYLIAEQVDFPEKYYGYGGVIGAIYDVQGIEQRIGGKNLDYLGDYFDYSTMAVINDEFYFKGLKSLKEKSKPDYERALRILSYKNDKDINKIYDLGNIYILKGVE
ncbi:Dolichyl-phosphate-mannose-protein mannosyltransferase [Thermoplasmatales archaeon SCGC AB-539-N05]|nr:Dolichyl-phosphate-mannose-protein mannosyltransferase [Thermoplasmatales archaeon SCGC AB-539-N05]